MLKLTFVTSSSIKLHHAIHLCDDYDIKIDSHKKMHYGKGYEEPRIRERDELLKRSIEDALKRWRKYASRPDETFFFIEDTSVIIHALSNDKEEIPGVDIKYWMKENDFKSIDCMLKEKGNDRRVTVRSDVLLTLPRELKDKHSKPYIRFTSETHGTLSEKEYDFTTNPVYPWLDNKTFNKWFIPDGCSHPISMLKIDEADKHDFRVSAFRDMLKFLEENNQVKRKNINDSLATMVQVGFPIGMPLYLVSGPTCAGKTSLAEFMVDKYGCYHIEASDFMYLKYFQKLGIGSSITISDFAKKSLEEKPDIVVEEILQYLESMEEGPVIITGLRTSDEINAFKRNYRGSYDVKVVTVDADEDVRLNRYLKRNRGGKTSKEKFLKDSGTQLKMGLDNLMKIHADSVILNNSTFDLYYSEFTERYKDELINANSSRFDTSKIVPPSALEDAVMIAMFNSENEFLTTAEIAKLINKTFSDYELKNKSKNNVSRYFNQSFHPYFEAIKERNVNKYRLSQTGRMHAIWLSNR